MKKSILSFGLTFMLSATFFGQGTVEPCGTTESYLEILAKYPEIKALREAADKEAIEIDRILHAQDYRKGSQTGNEKADKIMKAQGTIYYIPMVFHVLHLNGSENISDAQIKSCVAQHNKDFSATTADTANTQTPFKGLEADVEIRFALATIDPSGNCTNGITRHYDANTNWDKGVTPFDYTWDRTKYYNVYVVKSFSSGIAGYSSFPGTNGPLSDVTVCLSNYIGNMGTSTPGNAHTMTHETGHFLNLYHIWDCCTANNTACGTDAVGDTPQTKGYSPGNCPTGTGNQICNAGISENPNNFMDYSYCYTMFTAGQATRMRNTIINNVGNVGRANLGSASNGIATGITTPQVCIPVANFKSNVRTVCPNVVITFSDSSANAQITSWNWSFPGGTLQGGSTLTDSMPKVSYATPGTYAVSYTASTSAGGNSITKSTITVNNNVASYNIAWSEGFETATLPNSDWDLYSSIGFDWAITGNTAATGAKCVWIDNFANSPGSNSVLQSTSFDISSFITPKLTFKYAYQQQVSTNVDKMQIFSSTDCGNTWVSRWSRQGTTLANVTPAASTSPFTPASSQFMTYTVNINGVAGSSNVRFRFQFFADVNGQGNNLYLDDINLFDASVGINSFETQIGLDIYPNPSSGNINIGFNLNENHSISVNVTDLIGRTVEAIPAKQFAAGETTITIADKTTYQAGVYFVNVNVDGKIISKKVIIQ